MYDFCNHDYLIRFTRMCILQIQNLFHLLGGENSLMRLFMWYVCYTRSSLLLSNLCKLFFISSSSVNYRWFTLAKEFKLAWPGWQNCLCIHYKVCSASGFIQYIIWIRSKFKSLPLHFILFFPSRMFVIEHVWYYCLIYAARWKYKPLFIFLSFTECILQWKHWRNRIG